MSLTRFTLIILFLFFACRMDAQPFKKHTLGRYLALGDSYTIGEKVSEPERWPNQLVDSLSHHGIQVGKPTIIATTGWRTDDLSRAMKAADLKNEFGLVSLLIGVNNQYQGKPSGQYEMEFEELLKSAIQLAGGNKESVFVVSIPDYGYTPFGKPKQAGISEAINVFNAINKRITLKHGIKYVDITRISRRGMNEPDLIASDGLHPSGRMYGLWVQEIVREVFTD
jgi:lysophospholipase L1-like esterase